MVSEFENINEAQLFFINRILFDGSEITSRGNVSKEVSPAVFIVRNPRKRITTLHARKWNFAAAVGELIWHLSGSNKVDVISNYLKQWSKFSDDGETITGSCYGYKIFDNKNGESPWQKLINLLQTDPGSRRAVINLYDWKEGLNVNSSDVSCTNTLQFLIRNEKVDLIVNMRSNDLIWGLPYDFFLFSFLQELLSKILNLQLGKYTHIAGSLHIYKRHYKLANEILKVNNYDKGIEMPAIEDPEDVTKFINLEKQVRSGIKDFRSIENEQLNTFWLELLRAVFSFQQGKLKNKLKTS